jgi:O-antigen/teichoic acid export membrane protein
MSKRKLVKNSIFYTIGNILPQAAGFILLPIYTTYLDPDQYGIVNAMTVLAGVVGIIFTLGIDRGIYRLYYDYADEERKTYLGTIIIGLSTFSVLIFLIAISFPQLLENVFESIPFYPYYLLMLLFTVLSKVITVPAIYLRISEQAAKFVWLQISAFLLTASFNLLFIIYYKEGAIGMLKGTLFANLIMAPIFYLVTYKAIVFKFNVKYFKDSVKFSLPLLPAFIFAWILNLSDRIFLERFLSLNEVGIYSFGYKLASLVTVIAGGVFTAYNPHFYKLANEDGKEIKRKIETYNNSIILLILVICFFIAFFSKEAIEILISSKYFEAIKIIPILCIAFFFSQITGFLNLMIYQSKKTVQIMYITLTAAIINVISNLVFIPVFGMMGSAMATLVSFISLFAIQYWYAKKCYFIPYHWNVIIPLILGFIGIYVVVDFIAIQNVFYGLLLKTIISIVIVLLFWQKNKKQLSLLFSKK